MKCLKKRLLCCLMIIMIYSVIAPQFIFAVNFSMGDNNYSVTAIQKMLNATMGAGLTEDGKFGSGTKQAVIDFQRSHGLPSDGIVGPITWNKLAEKYTKLCFNINKIYRIKSIYWGYLDIPGQYYNENGTQLQLWEHFENNVNQMFRFEMDGNYVKIIALNGKTVEVRNSNTAAGESVAIWDDESGYLTKRWLFTPNPTGNGILITNANSSLTINVSRGNFENGTKIWQYPWDDTVSSVFTLEEISNSEYRNIGQSNDSSFDIAEGEFASNPDTFDVLQQNTVDLPYASTNISSGGCGPTAMYNTFKWFGNERSLENIANTVSSSYVRGAGTDINKMLKIMNENGWLTFYKVVYNKSDFISFLQNNKNSAVIFGLSNKFLKNGASNAYHVVSAVATDGDNVFILDSATKSNKFADENRLNRGYWISADKLMEDSPYFRLVTIN